MKMLSNSLIQDSTKIRIFGVVVGPSVLHQSCNCREKICSDLSPFLRKLQKNYYLHLSFLKFDLKRASCMAKSLNISFNLGFISFYNLQCNKEVNKLIISKLTKQTLHKLTYNIKGKEYRHKWG